ncbi:hypothetical protein HK405_004699 [Cladochytrium tenue]|nr:hypothetical protein HK405_004699 [Cladochytrium tenue]
MIQPFRFGKPKARSPSDIVRATRDAVLKFDTGDRRKLNEEISKNLVAMKVILYGEGESEPSPEQVTQLFHEINNGDILPLFIKHIGKFDFEAKKDVAQIFNNLLRRQVGSRYPIAEFMGNRPELLFALSAA